MPKERNKADSYHEKDTSQPLTIVRNMDIINGIKLSDDSKNDISQEEGMVNITVSSPKFSSKGAFSVVIR